MYCYRGKNRHRSLDRTLPTAVACGVPVFICDQSTEAYRAPPQTGSGGRSRSTTSEIASLPAARNHLLRICAGFEVVIFIDDDCDLDPSILTCQQLATDEAHCPAWGPVIEARGGGNNRSAD